MEINEFKEFKEGDIFIGDITFNCEIEIERNTFSINECEGDVKLYGFIEGDVREIKSPEIPRRSYSASIETQTDPVSEVRKELETVLNEGIVLDNEVIYLVQKYRRLLKEYQELLQLNQYIKNTETNTKNTITNITHNNTTNNTTNNNSSAKITQNDQTDDDDDDESQSDDDSTQSSHHEQIISKLKELEELNEKFRELEAKIEESNKTNEGLLKKIDDLEDIKNSNDELKTQFTQLSSQFNKLLTNFNSEQISMNEKITALTSKNKELNKIINDSLINKPDERVLEGINARLADLQSRVEEAERYAERTIQIMESSKRMLNPDGLEQQSQESEEAEVPSETTAEAERVAAEAKILTAEAEVPSETTAEAERVAAEAKILTAEAEKLAEKTNAALKQTGTFDEIKNLSNENYSSYLNLFSDESKACIMKLLNNNNYEHIKHIKLENYITTTHLQNFLNNHKPDYINNMIINLNVFKYLVDNTFEDENCDMRGEYNIGDGRKNYYKEHVFKNNFNDNSILLNINSLNDNSLEKLNLFVNKVKNGEYETQCDADRVYLETLNILEITKELKKLSYVPIDDLETVIPEKFKEIKQYSFNNTTNPKIVLKIFDYLLKNNNKANFFFIVRSTMLCLQKYVELHDTLFKMENDDTTTDQVAIKNNFLGKILKEAIKAQNKENISVFLKLNDRYWNNEDEYAYGKASNEQNIKYKGGHNEYNRRFDIRPKNNTDLDLGYMNTYKDDIDLTKNITTLNILKKPLYSAANENDPEHEKQYFQRIETFSIKNNKEKTNENTKKFFSSENKMRTYYGFGSFNEIFYPHQKNEDIVKLPSIDESVINKINKGTDVFIVGYGTSGSGKTSSLIHLNKGDDEKKKEGIIVKLCNQIGGDIKVTVLEQFDTTCKKLLNEDYMNQENKEKFIKQTEKSILLKKYEEVRFTKNNGQEYYTLFEKQDVEHFFRSRIDNEHVQWNTESTLSKFLETYVDKDRLVKATPNNPQSSRSHVVVIIEFVNDSTTTTQKGKLIVGDFAGIENTFDQTDMITLSQFANIRKTDDTGFFYDSKEIDFQFNPKTSLTTNNEKEPIENVLKYINAKLTVKNTNEQNKNKKTTQQTEQFSLSTKKFAMRTQTFYPGQEGEKHIYIKEQLTTHYSGSNDMGLFYNNEFLPDKVNIPCKTYTYKDGEINDDTGKVEILFNNKKGVFKSVADQTDIYNLNIQKDSEEKNKLINLLSFVNEINQKLFSVKSNNGEFKFFPITDLGGEMTNNKDYTLMINCLYTFVYENIKNYIEKGKGDISIKSLITKYLNNVTVQFARYPQLKGCCQVLKMCASVYLYKMITMKEIVFQRKNEGIYTNGTLNDLEDSIREYLRGKNGTVFMTNPNIYCNKTCITNRFLYPINLDSEKTSKKEGFSASKLLYKFDDESEDKKKENQKMHLVFFGFLNIARNANNPPPVEYLSIKKLLVGYNDYCNKSDQPVPTTLQNMYSSVSLKYKELYPSYVIEIPSNLKIGIIKELISNIEQHNAATSIGTLFFLHRMISFFTINDYPCELEEEQKPCLSLNNCKQLKSENDTLKKLDMYIKGRYFTLNEILCLFEKKNKDECLIAELNNILYINHKSRQNEYIEDLCAQNDQGGGSRIPIKTRKFKKMYNKMYKKTVKKLKSKSLIKFYK